MLIVWGSFKTAVVWLQEPLWVIITRYKTGSNPLQVISAAWLLILMATDMPSKMRVWALISVNWPIIKKKYSFQAKVLFQGKTCAHEISHWFENPTEINTICLKWNQINASIIEN